MNMSLVKAFPKKESHEISIETPDWRERFSSLIKDRKNIRFDLFTMPTLPQEIQDELGRSSYVQLILESDQDQRLLIPALQ